MKKEFRLFITIFITIIMVVIIFFASAFHQRKLLSQKYNNAKKDISQGNYEEAINIIKSIPNYKMYKDADSLLSKAKKEKKYEQAIKNYKDGKYDSAKRTFVELDNYKDSKFYLAQIDIKLLEQSQEIIYQKADHYFKKKEYSNAIELYNTIIDYKDSKQLLNDCKKQFKRQSLNNIMAGGINNSITITNMGHIKTAGINGFDQLSVDSWKNIVSIDIYGSLTIGLLNDKTAKITGTYDSGKKISNLEQWTDLIDVAAGEQFVVGLKSNGDVIADGHPGDGQLEVDDWKDVIAIDAGSRFTVGLTKYGKLLFTGASNKQAEKFEENKNDWKDVVNISASGGEKNHTGSGHTVGLKSNGTLVAVGDNTYGQCDFSDKEKWSDIVKVATGDWYTVGLKSNGTVVMTGNNFPRHKYINKEILEKYTNIVDIAAGYGQTLLLTEYGEIICFGFDDEGKDKLNGFKEAMIPQY